MSGSSTITGGNPRQPIKKQPSHSDNLNLIIGQISARKDSQISVDSHPATSGAPVAPRNMLSNQAPPTLAVCENNTAQSTIMASSLELTESSCEQQVGLTSMIDTTTNSQPIHEDS